LTPAQVRHAYGFDQVAFTANGKTIQGDGSGQTIAIVNAFDDPRIASDVDYFDRIFGLDRQYGLSSHFLAKALPQGTPSADPGSLWELETALDVEWAHAIAPGAHILLVESKTGSFYDLMGAADYARRQPGVSVVSLSWGVDEFAGEMNWDSEFRTPAGHTGVAFVAASGDSGAPPIWPAVVPSVLGVGATTLTVNAAGTYVSEAGWGGSGGGYSSQEKVPSYQRSVQPYSMRSSPDVAYNGDPDTGFYVYTTYPLSGETGWFSIGGTSAGTPQWAALLAIVDQGRALQGKPTLDAAQLLPAVYSLPAGDFHDIVSGFNGYYAGRGYDVVTGRGTPFANKIIRDLVAAPATAQAQAEITVRPMLAGSAPDAVRPVMMGVALDGLALGDLGSHEGIVPAVPVRGLSLVAYGVQEPVVSRSSALPLQAPDGGRAGGHGAGEMVVEAAAPEEVTVPVPLFREEQQELPAEIAGSISRRQTVDACFAETAWLDHPAATVIARREKPEQADVMTLLELGACAAGVGVGGIAVSDARLPFRPRAASAKRSIKAGELWK
jgi:hypothetical protein